MIDEWLKSIGLSYDDLDTPGHEGEIETLNSWLTDISQKVVSVEDIKKHIASMKASVEVELSKSELNDKQDLYLKGRLKNYLMLEAFLTSPEKAKQELDKLMASRFSKVK